MKFIKRVLILVVAAWLGTTLYVRFLAVENIAATVQKTMPASSEMGSSPANGNGAGGAKWQTGHGKFKGGIGPVGNPHTDGGAAYR